MLADRAVDRNVRRHLALPQALDKAGPIVGIVRAQRDAMLLLSPPAFPAIDHGQGRFPFRRPGRVSQRRIDRKPVAVLHQNMPHEAQPALAAGCLAIEL